MCIMRPLTLWKDSGANNNAQMTIFAPWRVEWNTLITICMNVMLSLLHFERFLPISILNV